MFSEYDAFTRKYVRWSPFGNDLYFKLKVRIFQVLLPEFWGLSLIRCPPAEWRWTIKSMMSVDCLNTVQFFGTGFCVPLLPCNKKKVLEPLLWPLHFFGSNLSEKLILRRSKVKGKLNHTLTLIIPLLVLRQSHFNQSPINSRNSFIAFLLQKKLWKSKTIPGNKYNYCN